MVTLVKTFSVMKNLLVCLLFMMVSPWVVAQTTLEQCQSAARDNYPMIRQYSLIESSKEYSLKNASAGRYPQVSLSAKASYQSDVVSIPDGLIPAGVNVGITPLPKDQYMVGVDVTQSLWDGGITRSSRRAIELDAQTQERKLDVEIYGVRQRVNQLFFGVLTINEQLRLNSLLDQELRRNYTKVQSYIDGGIANSADLDAVEVEIYTNSQQRAAMESARHSYLDMLSRMTGMKIDTLVRPLTPEIEHDSLSIARPELSYFDAQVAQIQNQQKAINARNAPKFSLFVQGAYGNPGLNMLKAGFTPYAIGGVRIGWNLSGYYASRADKRKLINDQAGVENMRNLFLYNTDLSIDGVDAELAKLRAQIKDDDRIIELRGNIKRAAQAKVEAGTMSVRDMLTEVTSENSAMVNKALHDVELLMNMYDLKWNTNN